MKKVWIAVMIFAMLAAGCSGNNGNESNNGGPDSTPETSADAGNGNDGDGNANEDAETDENAETNGDAGEGEVVTVVFPASLNNGDVEGMTAEIKEAGATDVSENGDGSVSVAISQQNLDKLLEKYHTELLALIDGVHSGGNNSSIKDLTYDEETFGSYDITVDRAAYESEESMDGLVIFGLSMQSLMYQIYSGVEEADVKVVFNMIDESTGEVYETSVLPEGASAE